MGANQNRGAGRQIGRGQAAVEYLTTYGWAIMIVVIVLAALILLGIFDTSNKIPERCSFQPGIECESAVFKGSSTGSGAVIVTELHIRNRLTEKMLFCGLEASTMDLPQDVPEASDCLDEGQRFIAPGDSATVNFLTPGGFSGGAVPLLFSITFPPLPNPVFVYNNGGTTTGVAKKGDSLKTNLFLFYLKESDSGTGKARISKGEAIGRVQ